MPPTILVTNDDGVRSPGLLAAAQALLPLGRVVIVAPRQQSSGAGRSLPSESDGLITTCTLPRNGQPHTAYAVGGTPAQAVLHGVLEILEAPPDLVVSGINYGENLATGVTVSGTVGAALEGAALGIPALAISLEVPKEYHLSHSDAVDFSTAAHFTRFFAQALLSGRDLPPDVDVLKVDVPADATPQTPWKVCRQSRKRYYRPLRPQRRSWDEPGTVGYTYGDPPETFPKDSDVYVLKVERKVAVVPLSLDCTSRVPFDQLERWLRSGA